MWLGLSLAALVALLVLLVCLLLLVPVALEAAWGEERRSVALAGPGLRLAFDVSARTAELRVFSLRIGRWSMGARRRRPKRPRQRKAKGKRRRSVSLRRLWRQRGRIFAALRAFFRRVQVRRIEVQATLATPDPAVTGWLAGAAYAVRAAAPPRVQRGLALGADFSSETPRVALDAALRVMPLHAAILGLRLWRVVRRARPARARRKSGQDEATTRRAGGGRE